MRCVLTQSRSVPRPPHVVCDCGAFVLVLLCADGGAQLKQKIPGLKRETCKLSTFSKERSALAGFNRLIANSRQPLFSLGGWGGLRFRGFRSPRTNVLAQERRLHWAGTWAGLGLLHLAGEPGDTLCRVWDAFSKVLLP